jgi:hypothetical protein
MPDSSSTHESGAPYVATSCAAAVLAAVVLAKTIFKSIDEAMLYWFIYVLCCGILINYRENIPWQTILLYSLPSPTLLLAVEAYMLVAAGAIHLSGLEINRQNLGARWPMLAFLWLLSVICIWIFSFSREVILSALRSLFALPNSRARKIESTLNWMVRIVGLGALLIRALA